MHGRTHTLVNKEDRKGISSQWPHIGRFLSVDDSTGRFDDDFSGWSWRAEELSQEERAAGYQEWADFYEWRLKQRATELAGDRGKRHLVEQWTDSMAYCCRRLAIRARGDDPGEWVSQSERRPDLDAEREAIVVDIIAELDTDRQPAGQLAMAG